MPLISRILAAGISIGLWLCSDTHVLGGSNTCYQLVRSRGFCWCSLSSDSLGRLCSETVPTSLITRRYCLSHPFFTNSMIQLADEVFQVRRGDGWLQVVIECDAVNIFMVIFIQTFPYPSFVLL